MKKLLVFVFLVMLVVGNSSLLSLLKKKKEKEMVLSDQTFNAGSSAVVRKWDNAFNGLQDFAVSGWIRLTKNADRSSMATAYHFGASSNPSDKSNFGDRTLALFVLNETFYFASYDLNTGKKSIESKVNFQKSNERTWCYIYHSYSKSKAKLHAFAKFMKGGEPMVVDLTNIRHQDANLYTMFIGQSFSYKGYPGRIWHLYLCGGLKCYKENHDDDINSGPGGDDNEPNPPNPQPPKPNPNPNPQPPQPPQPPKDDRVHDLLGDSCDINGGVVPAYKRWDNQFNNIQEFAIKGWMKYRPGADRENWYSVFHFNSNLNPQDGNVHGDRTLSLFVWRTSAQFSTYNLNTNNVNIHIEYQFNDEGKWGMFFHTYSEAFQKSFAVLQFGQSNPLIIPWDGIRHHNSNVYHLWVGQSFGYRVFPGCIVNTTLCAGAGCYREDVRNNRSDFLQLQTLEKSSDQKYQRKKFMQKKNNKKNNKKQ